MNRLPIQERSKYIKPNVLRNRGQVPGTIYGKTLDNRNIKLSRRDMIKALYRQGEVFEVTTKNGKAFVKFGEVQTDPLTGEYLHFSLVQLPRGEESTVYVPVELTGEPVGVKKGGTLMILKDQVLIQGMPKEIPEKVVGDISEMDIGDKFVIDDLSLLGDIDTAASDDSVIAICKPPVKLMEVELEDEANPSLARFDDLSTTA